jgi:hypothetical protein
MRPERARGAPDTHESAYPARARRCGSATVCGSCRTSPGCPMTRPQQANSSTMPSGSWKGTGPYLGPRPQGGGQQMTPPAASTQTWRRGPRRSEPRAGGRVDTPAPPVHAALTSHHHRPRMARSDLPSLRASSFTTTWEKEAFLHPSRPAGLWTPGPDPTVRTRSWPRPPGLPAQSRVTAGGGPARGLPRGGRQSPGSCLRAVECCGLTAIRHCGFAGAGP